MTISRDQLNEYQDRREQAYNEIKNLVHGAQAACAFDIRVSSSSVSAVLSGYYINQKILGKIEAWIEENRGKYLNPGRSGKGGKVDSREAATV